MLEVHTSSVLLIYRMQPVVKLVLQEGTAISRLMICHWDSLSSLNLQPSRTGC